MARVYATPEDWTASPYGAGAAPEDAEARLARASLDVDRVLIGAVYATDSAGLPTSSVVAEALRDATIAQAVHVRAQESGSSAAVASIGFASGSITYAGDGAPGRPGADDRYAPDVATILQLARLYVWVGTY